MPPKNDSQYRKWKTKNATIMGWLLSPVKPEISEHFLFPEMAYLIWDALAKLYYEIGPTAKVCTS